MRSADARHRLGVDRGAQVVDAAAEALLEAQLQRGDEGVQLPVAADVGQGQQQSQRLGLELAVQVEAILHLLLGAGLAGGAGEGVLRLVVGLLDHAAPGAYLEARPHGRAAGDRAGGALIAGLAEVDVAEGGPLQVLEAERASCRRRPRHAPARSSSWMSTRIWRWKKRG